MFYLLFLFRPPLILTEKYLDFNCCGFRRGFTPLDEAKRFDRSEVVDFLSGKTSDTKSTKTIPADQGNAVNGDAVNGNAVNGNAVNGLD